ncbi:MAG: formylmethanofuran--tetrahydromethanopterin N-formyltransferase [Candidatus Symbiobacter sp.]|nr:formylmethanofuran--tetrahydromethanopterin N-formyltransferase [Candidatus Symbiobacter sp.]
MHINNIIIRDNFAEAFDMRATRLIITADTAHWARVAGQVMTGFATSVIACGVEAAVEHELTPNETPDGRPGVAVLLFGFSHESLIDPIRNRVGQTILTCPGTACFAGIDPLPAEENAKKIPMGQALRYFGDGWQTVKRVGGRRMWRIPVMDGEFLCEDRVASVPAIGGGNFLVLGESRAAALAACERAVAAMSRCPSVIMPFPGGVVRSGSKVGSRYKILVASTNDAYCPTLRGVTKTALPDQVAAVYEIVIDGLNYAAIAAAMAVGIRAACDENAENSGVVAIDAGNYGGNLGRHHFHLRQILAPPNVASAESQP